ncbi:M20 family metallopeptidase [Chryseobacterium aquifrigidense]|uniref:Glutamate carboxypeptidase n=1 Tax=Chryseobacterium aquifrigidense TaxID=558021 RepID=A0A543EKN2_9FLAO|nr:M20 family metallopeptidase [Chryseobacterium aquifrigidense]TQM22137.1 glutamate carboxypeptidase [Chryseobacterium aquifrigidense]
MIKHVKYLIVAGIFLSFNQPRDKTPNEKDIIDFIIKNKQNQLKLLENLVNINSETSNVEGVKRNGEIIQSELEALGFNVKWHNLPAEMHHAGSLVATIKGNSGKKILIIGHLDTVFPIDSPFQRFTLSSDHQYATGPGVIDAKGGVVTILYVMKALHHVGALNNADITIVLTGDEELAAKPTSISRKTLIDIAKNSDIALGFEFALSPDELIVGRRGLDEWFLTSTGKSQHSATIFQPDTGFGAVYEASRVLNEIRQNLSLTPGLTINTGLLLGGQKVHEDLETGTGSASGRKTIVPAIAYAHGDMRFLSDQQRNEAQKNMVQISTRSLEGTNSSISFKPIIPPMQATKSNDKLLALYSTINQNLGGSAIKAASPALRGGADISYTSPFIKAGLDGLGPWGKGAHTENETLEIKALTIATQRTALFIADYIK